jgi:hypothetical protein
MMRTRLARGDASLRGEQRQAHVGIHALPQALGRFV